MVHLILAASVLIALMGRGKSKYFFAVACWVLFLFAALRYMYGNDYPGYYAHYLEIRAGGESPYDEWLFTLLNQVCPSFYVLIALTSAMFVYGVYRLITDNLSTWDAWMGLLIFVISPYLFLMNLSAIRQCLAMMCFVAAVRYAAERRLMPYVLLVLAACLFHKSAALLFPAWFLTGPRPVRKGLVCGIVLAVFALLFVVDLNTVVLAVARIFDDKNYIHYAIQGVRNSLRATLLTFISFVYVLGNLPRVRGKALVCGKMYLVGLTCGVLAYHISMFTRVQMYFDIFGVVAIPAIIREDLNRGPVRVIPGHLPATLWDIINKYALPALVFLVFVLRYYSFFTNPSWSAFFEYRTIFSGM